MMQIEKDEPIFKAYVKHVLQWEGKTSKDPDDTAASCAPFPGAYHTNKGVTFCTFKKLAGQLEIYPVTYERFLKLTDDDIGSFAFHFCQEARASELQDSVALSITEAAWGSGPKPAQKHLQAALNTLGFKLDVDGNVGKVTIAAALSVEEHILFDSYWIQRKAFLKNLTDKPKWAKWKNGWNNRINSFFKLFNK